jgi:hypothetical protein
VRTGQGVGSLFGTFVEKVAFFHLGSLLDSSAGGFAARILAQQLR